MPIESATYISDLNASNPIGATDPLSSADDHLRLLKSTIKASFPGITGAMNATQGQLNNLNSLAALSVLANATGGAAAPAALSASANGQVLARIAGALVFSSDFPQLSVDNIFSKAGGSTQTLTSTSANRAAVQFQTSSVTRGLFGADGAAGDIVVGSALGDLSMRVVSGNVNLSLDNGGTIHHKFAAAAASTVLNGITLTDFARLGQSNTFTSGALTLSNAGTPVLSVTDTTTPVTTAIAADDSVGYVQTTTNHPLHIRTNATVALVIDASRNFDFKAGTVTTNGASASEVGWQGTPPNTQNGNYTLVLGDRGGLIRKQSGAGNTITIPANASVAFPDGTVITIDNDSGNAVSIAITTDVMELAGAGTTGTRTLSDNGSCTIQKIASTKWRVAGIGVT
jgi:hypothetical protein